MTSYHRPILFSLEPIGNLGPFPFKFSPSWISEPGFFYIVSRAWKKFYQGSSSFIWEQKLINVKKEPKAWLEIRNQNLGQEKVSSIKTLEEIQEKME